MSPYRNRRARIVLAILEPFGLRFEPDAVDGTRLLRRILITKDLLDVILLHKGNAQVINTYALSKLEIEAGEALQKWNDWLDDLLSGPDMFPGGRDLPRMSGAEIARRLADFRKGWPERADQRNARIAREDAAAIVGAPRGRKARAEAKKRERLREAGANALEK